LTITVLAAATLGALLPILFKKLKLDPALMSGPFIYLQISTMIIGQG